MKRFIHKDQMNNSIFFVIVELVVLFMFRSSIHTTDVMMNTFSVIVIMLFIIPVVLSYFSTDILRIFNYMIISRFQSKKKMFGFIIERIVMDSFKMACLLLVPVHVVGTVIYHMNYFMIMRYYFSFFITLVTVCLIYIIVYFKMRNKNISIIISCFLCNITTLLGSLLRQNSIPSISSIMLLEYEKPATLLIVMIVLIVLLSAILYRAVTQFELLGESKNVL